MEYRSRDGADNANSIERFPDVDGRSVACAHSGLAFDTPDTYAYLYNARSELTNATAAVDSGYRYGYNFDDIGNRRSSLERRVQSAEYEANSLNQYTAVDDFTPQYDDGNETLVKTATGIWQVTYNGENRPVRWELVSPDSNTPNSNTQTLLRMSFDRMGRRVTKNDQRFVYNGYLQICNYNSSTSTSHFNYYIWDPTEPVATRPLAWKRGTSVAYYTHDGNKNVSGVIASNTDVAAHYEYAPFGALTISRGASAADNPWRFSSEYAEDDTATVYYNYRHYEPATGRWMQRDPIEEAGGVGLFLLLKNSICNSTDRMGLKEDYRKICNDAITKYWNAYLKKWFKDNSPSGCEQPSVSCDCCPPVTDGAGNEKNKQRTGHTKIKNSAGKSHIKICIGQSQSEIEEVLKHELYHAIDYCKTKKKFSCEEEVCSEVKAYSNVDCANLSGDLKTNCVKGKATDSASKHTACKGKSDLGKLVDNAIASGNCQ